jgi:predicted DNA-binding protein with PD1-like motif
MRKLLLIPIFFLMGKIMLAQDITPAVIVEVSDFKQVVIIRLKSGTDLLTGLNDAVKDKAIKNGVILAGIGSVTDYHFHVVSDKNLPPAEEYIIGSVPMDLVSVQGYILNGRVHAHISLSDNKCMIGGHLESGTKALTFLIITIGVLPDDLDIGNLDNYKY